MCSEDFEDIDVDYPACCEIQWLAFEVCPGNYRLTGLATLNTDQLQGIRWGLDINQDQDFDDEGEWNNYMTYLSFYDAETLYGDMWNGQHFISVQDDGLLWVGVYFPEEGNPTDDESICLDMVGD